MPSVRRRVRYMAGWLVIPVSLLLMTGCRANPADTQQDASATHTHEQAIIEGSPFQRIFTGEADLVVLTFFDLYCVACQQSAQNFNQLYNRMMESFPDSQIQVTGVGIGDTAFELSVFQRKYELGYRCLPDPEKEFEEPFAIRGTPTILVFQRKGSECLEIYRHEGRFRMDDLEKLVAYVSQNVSIK